MLETSQNTEGLFSFCSIILKWLDGHLEQVPDGPGLSLRSTLSSSEVKGRSCMPQTSNVQY